MEQVLDKIIKNKTTCYFISPHLDDAILSAGGLISYIATKTTVKIVSVFTEASKGPYTVLTKRFLRKTGFTDARELYVHRREEDTEVCERLQVKLVHLGFTDGAFRKRNFSKVLKQTGKLIPEITHLYPFGRKVLKLANEDQALEQEITKKLWQTISVNQNNVIFCPLGTVNHMDHELTQRACVSLVTIHTGQTLVFWQDYPYITKKQYTNTFIQKNNLHPYTWDKNLEQKKELIMGYKTQIKSLFPDSKIPLIPEVFYF